MKYSQHSFDQFGLHLAATVGDEEGVAYALEQGADVNSLDSAGKTALMCAVAGEQWQDLDAFDASFMTPGRLNAIRRILKHPEVSLYTLNAPHSSMNGVIPLGMAAWLNVVEAVQTLLEDSSGRVSVDGMDAHGATALMYAARDGNLGVVQSLLSHGARPDFRDCNHRTSVQFALQHPQILWLCESILRRHRWRESESSDRTKLYRRSEDLLRLALSSLPSDSLEPPPLSIFTSEITPKMTDTLVECVASSNLSFLQSLILSPALPPSSPPSLYPMSVPVLVNRLDAKGWSPIHHLCATELPCIDILDSLYCAGADVSLFTTHEHYTPLHILAQSVRLSLEDEDESQALYHFVVHLIRDLRAPLSARDRNDETCIHIAAAHGKCINLLTVLLDFDTTNAVREQRNAQGLTAFEVARPEFRAAFAKDHSTVRSVSPMSARTIRPVESFASLASPTELHSMKHDDDARSLSFHQAATVQESTHRLLSCLRTTSLSINHRNDSKTTDNLADLLSEATRLSRDIAHHFRSCIEEASKEVQALRSDYENIHTLLDQVMNAAIKKVRDEGSNSVDQAKERDSEDSEQTMFSRSSGSASAASITATKMLDANHVSVATQTSSSFLKPSSRAVTWLESLLITDAAACPDHLAAPAAIEQELYDLRRKMGKSGAGWHQLASTEMCDRLRQLEKKHRKLTDKIPQSETAERKLDLHEITSPKKLTKWIKRFITHEKPRTSKVEIVFDIDEQASAVARQAMPAGDVLDRRVDVATILDLRIETALRTSNVVLGASKRDLRAIEQCLNAAEQFLGRANQFIARAESAIRKAVKKREVMIENLRVFPEQQSPVEKEQNRSLGAPDHSLLSLRPSFASLSSINSAQSSIVPTLTENDDEETRTIRRLLLRKVEAGITGAWDEVDKVFPWLSIVKEAVRGVKRRAYL